MENRYERNFNWIPVIELAVLAFTSLGTTIGLFIHSDNNMRKMEEKIYNSLTASEARTERILEGMRQDILTYHRENSEMMRDFHGRLCAIEERNKRQ